MIHDEREDSARGAFDDAAWFTVVCGRLAAASKGEYISFHMTIKAIRWLPYR